LRHSTPVELLDLEQLRIALRGNDGRLVDEGIANINAAPIREVARIDEGSQQSDDERDRDRRSSRER